MSYISKFCAPLSVLLLTLIGYGFSGFVPMTDNRWVGDHPVGIKQDTRGIPSNLFKSVKQSDNINRDSNENITVLQTYARPDNYDFSGLVPYNDNRVTSDQIVRIKRDTRGIPSNLFKSVKQSDNINRDSNENITVLQTYARPDNPFEEQEENSDDDINNRARIPVYGQSESLDPFINAPNNYRNSLPAPIYSGPFPSRRIPTPLISYGPPPLLGNDNSPFTPGFSKSNSFHRSYSYSSDGGPPKVKETVYDSDLGYSITRSNFK